MPPHAPEAAGSSKPRCSGGSVSLVVVSLATVALDVVEVLAAGIRVRPAVLSKSPAYIQPSRTLHAACRLRQGRFQGDTH